MDSLQTWKAFVAAYQIEAVASLRNRHQVIENVNLSLRNYVQPLSSPSFDWITFLTLSNVICSRTDLIQVSQLPNIGALTIGPNVQAEDVAFDDSIVRSWARIASTSKAFNVLRVLSFRSQKHITSRIFPHLNCFVALAVLNAEGCSLSSEHKPFALDHGWKYRVGKELSNCLVKHGSERPDWDSTMHASFQLGGTYSLEALTAEGLDAINGLPRLHLSVGAVPQAAAVNVAGNGNMKSFHRARISPQECPTVVSMLSKRPVSQSHVSASKKPTIRASKQQNIEDFLMGFGG